MRRTGLLAIVVAGLLAGFRGEAAGQTGKPAPPGLARCEQVVFRHALDHARPFIVRIDTIGGAQPIRTEVDRRGRSRRTAAFRQADGPTTGVIYSSDGLILTSSFNFVRDPTVITVTLADGRRFVAELVARDYPCRLALLKIEARDLPAADWSPRTREGGAGDLRLRVGQRVLAAGYGFGTREPAPAAGILSALWRMSGQAVQTDARISPAHYGGPLLDIEGRVVGICVPMGPGEDALAGVQWYDSGIAFAIPRDHLAGRVARMARGETLRRGLLGLNLDTRARVVGGEPKAPARLQPAAASQPARPLPPDGLRIVGEPVGPAAKAGLRRGDVITHIDNVPTPDVVALRRELARRAAGDTIAVRYRRDGKVHEVSVTLATSDELRVGAASQPSPSR